MANHCVYDTCLVCGEEFCMRGCGYTCLCEHQASRYTIEKYLFWTPTELEKYKKEYLEE